MKQYKVLHVLPSTKDGGTMIFAKKQVDLLAELGVSQKEFYLSSRTSIAIVLKEFIEFRKTIKKYKPTAIHAHYGTVTALFSALASSLPLVITFRGSDLNSSMTKSFLRDFLGRLFSQLAALKSSRIICVSEQLKRRLWWRKDTASVITDGLDIEIFNPQPIKTSREELNWREHDKIVLFNGGLDPKSKRIDRAKEALEIVKKEFSNARLHVLDGSFTPEEVATALNASDCLLLASDFEGSPNIVKEAIACNTPVVSTDVGDVRERLDKVEPSFIVQADSNEIAQAIIKVLKQSSRSNGTEHVASISNEVIIKQIENIYSELAK